jgi:hypothetical protein
MLYCRENTEFAALPVDTYQSRALRSDQNERTGPDGLRVPLLGLFGEMGSLLTIPKRKQRETSSYHRAAVIEEVGDVLWYLSNLASRHDVRLSTLAKAIGTNEDLRVPQSSDPELTFAAVAEPQLSERKSDLVAESDYFALGGSVGRLMSEFATGQHFEVDQVDFVRYLARTFRLLIRVAANADIDLNFCAHNNLLKIESRWPEVRVYRRPFDAEFSKHEQLPRHIEMIFEERNVRGKIFVFQRCNDINIGDRLTDNRTEPDDYRFHDVFHLAYLTFLSWSPVMRALFKVKRKSSPEIDENEDGARAILIEEGIATWVFNHAHDHNLFAGVQNLDYSLLKAIRQLVSGYEVEQCGLWQWQEAILEGFRVFRALKDSRRGIVVADMDARTIAFRPLAT